MAGLLEKQPPGMGQTGMQPGMMQSGMEPGMEDESNVSPEEQEAYNQFVTNGMELMYSEQVMPQLLQTIAGDGNPIEGLGNGLAMIVMRLEDSAEEQGADVPGDVKLHAAQELLEQMVELAEQAGIHEYSEEEMESAFYFGLDLYRTTRQEQGKLDQGALAEDFNQLAAADQQGRADDILPGISEYAQRAPRPEDADAAMQQAGAPQPGAMRRGV